MVSLAEFLHHVLPSEGLRCWVALHPDKTRKKNRQQGHQDSNAHLENIIRGLDSQQWNAYLACASYKSSDSREQKNALGAKAFWLDIDAGPGKPYADAEAAVAALDAFCDALNLDYPTVVYSGNGVHAWFVLDRMLPAMEWTSAAKKFKALTEHFGLHADPARTADIASILRPPGTYNWKDAKAPREVVCLELMPAVRAEEFLAKIGALPQASPVMPTIHAPGLLDVGKNAMAIYGNSEPSSASVAAQNCRQLARMRDTAGNLPEPIWYAGLCILAHSTDGPQLAHEWSRGHPAYTAEETERKMQHAATNGTGPTTCARFQVLDAAGCAGCPFQVTSPIVLGRNGTVAPPVIPVTENEKPPLPYGFKWGRNMQLLATVKNDELLEDIVVSQYAIYLKNVRRGERSLDISFQFLQWFPHDGWQQIDIPAREFYGQNWAAVLGAYGVNIHASVRRHFITYVQRAQDMLRATARDQMRYDQFGWKNERQAFVLADTIFNGDGSNHKIAGSHELEKRGRMMLLPVQGSLQTWSAYANKLFIEGCEAQAFALLCSFAAPLMAFAGTEGGTILSLFSPESGTGKTTALEAIASVWGELECVRLIGMDTTVAKFRSISVLSNLPVIFDELYTRDPEMVKSFVTSFTTGRDKLRGQKDGTVQMSDGSWQTILVSASNLSLVDLLRHNSEDAQAARVFELPLDLPTHVKHSLTTDLTKGLMANRGYAGKAFVSYLMQPSTLEWAKDAVGKMTHQYQERLNAQSNARFIVRLLACAAVASVIVRKAGILEFSTERIMKWAIKQAAERCDEKPAFNAVEVLATIINENMLDCLVVDDCFHPRRPCIVRQKFMRALRMRYEIKTSRLYVSADQMRTWLVTMKKPVASMMRQLEEEQVLVKRKRLTNLGAGTDWAGAQIPCWEIDIGHPALSGTVRIVEVAQQVDAAKVLQI